MFVIDIVPFSSGTPSLTLSYRSNKRLATGTIVSVPLRRKTITGMVVECVSVRDVKIVIKKAPFTLRAGILSKTGQLPQSYNTAAKYTAMYHAATLGGVLRSLLPEAILFNGFPTKLARGARSGVSYSEAPYKQRIKTYRTYISKAKGSVLIVAPTTVEVEQLANTFNAIAITGELSPKNRISALNVAQSAPVIITTPSYAFTPIKHLTHIIMERESAGSWIKIISPQIDMRIAVRALARARCIPVTIGDYPLRLDVRPIGSAQLVETLKTPIKIIDTQEKKMNIHSHTFRAIPDTMQKILAETLSNGGRAAVITVRKGYAPAVVCRDCGTTVRDARGRALSLAFVGTHPVLRSADGNTLRDADVLCDLCGSWNLLPLGIGIERVIEELTRAFPETPIIRFDADTVRTPAAARRAAAQFGNHGTLIVGTEAVLPWLNNTVPLQLGIIASADTLLALPFWRSRERLMRLTLTLGQLSERLLVATRRIDDTAFTALTAPTTAVFFEEEDSLRKILYYPPYTHILTIRTRGTSLARLEEGESLIQTAVAPYKSIRLPDHHTTKNGSIRTLVIKIPQKEWPNENISKRIVQLPSWITCCVDSESLW